MGITIDDFVTFCDRTIHGTMAAVGRLDDAQLNRQPSMGGSTAFQLATHAMAAAGFWCAHVVAGEPSERIRSDEFEAQGTVADLESAAVSLRSDLRRLAPTLDRVVDIAHPATTQTPLAGQWTPGAALMHAYEELAQHLGHLEMTVDVVLAEAHIAS